LWVSPRPDPFSHPHTKKNVFWAARLVTKVAEQIVLDFGIRILHKTKVLCNSLVTIELLSQQPSCNLRQENRCHGIAGF